MCRFMDDAWDCGFVRTFRITDCGKTCPEQHDQGNQATRYQPGPCPGCSVRLRRKRLEWKPGMQHVEDVLADYNVIAWDTLEDLGLDEVKIAVETTGHSNDEPHRDRVNGEVDEKNPSAGLANTLNVNIEAIPRIFANGLAIVQDGVFTLWNNACNAIKKPSNPP